MDFHKLFESKKYARLSYTILIILVVFVIFQAGIFVGYKKASFSFGWGERYYNAFGEPARLPMMGAPRGFGSTEFPAAHGTAGRIVEITLPTVLIEGNDDVERVVNIDDKTVIKEMRGSVTREGLEVDDYIVVVGSPKEDGSINAKLIRVMPDNALRRGMMSNFDTNSTSTR